MKLAKNDLIWSVSHPRTIPIVHQMSTLFLIRVNLTGIWSIPVEQSERRREISFKTSSLDTFLSTKVDNASAWSGNDRTRSSKSLVLSVR